ncbi:uncharacterized protein [Misgurnus anguillicaudatus]|uniref:uncharacterized protein isoform X1 n=1 Tax=Misgurnus anguillicaudatus TaxID=75329 RepID=UPI003CCFCE7F
MELSLIAAQHFQAVSGAFMDSPCNDNSSHQTSTSNLNANFSRPAEQEEEGKFSSDAIWLLCAWLRSQWRHRGTPPTQLYNVP